MFSVRLLCIQTLHKIHMGLLVVQSAPEEGGGRRAGVLKYSGPCLVVSHGCCVEWLQVRCFYSFY